jgi:hypothetical protein
MRNSLRRLISRHHGDEVLEFGDTQAFLAKVDIGAFGAPAAYADSLGNVSLLAGVPFSVTTSPKFEPVSRSSKLHTRWSCLDWAG